MIPWYYSSSHKNTEMRTLLRYRRPLGAVNEYSAASFATDLVQMAAVVPEALSVGGNTGKVNPFTGVDLGNITGGVYQTSDLTDPKNSSASSTS